MPVTFKQIAANTATVTMQYGGETITIVYYPNLLTEKLLAQMETGAIKDTEFFPKLIKSWDVYEDDDQTVMFPLSRIDEFGMDFILKVAMAIVEHIRPETVAPQLTTNQTKSSWN